MFCYRFHFFLLQWNPREVNTLEVNSRLKSTPHGSPDFFFFVYLTLFLLKSTTSGRFSVKVNTIWPKQRESETKKRNNKGRESGFCLPPNSVESPQQSLCGLAAASDVEGETERGGGSCGWTVTNPVQYNAAHWWISHHSSPLCLIGPLQIARTVSDLPQS